MPDINEKALLANTKKAKQNYGKALNTEDRFLES